MIKPFSLFYRHEFICAFAKGWGKEGNVMCEMQVIHTYIDSGGDVVGSEDPGLALLDGFGKPKVVLSPFIPMRKVRSHVFEYLSTYRLHAAD